MSRLRLPRALGAHLLVACAPVASLAAQNAPPTVAVTHVTVIDVATGRRLPDQTVLVRQDRIARVGPASRIAVPAGARVVDGTGRFLIPGLWDMHAHLGLFGEGGLALMIANGVTGARVMGDVLDTLDAWRGRIASGALPGPRFARSGPILDDLPGLPGMLGETRVVVRDAAQGRRAVDSLQGRGVDFIKVHMYLPRDAYLGIAGEARRRGIAFAGHVPMSMTLAQVVAQGQRSVEHHWGLAMAGSAEGEAARQRAAATADSLRRAGADNFRALIRLAMVTDSVATAHYVPGREVPAFRAMAARGTWLCPTLVTLDVVARATELDVFHDPRLRFVSKEILPFLDAAEPDPRPASEAIESGRERIARWTAIIRDVHAAGVRFLAGSDEGVLGVYPGFSLHDELRLLVTAGLSPLEALQAATRNPAMALGWTDRTGAIAPGKLADLVLLDADPLLDITNTSRVHAVVAGGRAYDRAALDALLARAEALARH